MNFQWIVKNSEEQKQLMLSKLENKASKSRLNGRQLTNYATAPSMQLQQGKWIWVNRMKNESRVKPEENSPKR